MNHETASLIAWSMGTAAVSYGLLAVHLISFGQDWRGNRRVQAMLASVVLAALWAIVGTLFALTGKSILFFSSVLLDTLRYGAWYVFLNLLLSPAGTQRHIDSILPVWLSPGGFALVTCGVPSLCMESRPVGTGLPAGSCIGKWLISSALGTVMILSSECKQRE